MPVTEPSSTFVMDTGGANVKAGFSNSPVAKVIPNCITKAKSEKRRAFIGDRIDDCSVFDCPTTVRTRAAARPASPARAASRGSATSARTTPASTAELARAPCRAAAKKPKAHRDERFERRQGLAARRLIRE